MKLTIPPKLSVDSAGRVHGANVTWNSPWPCINGDEGGMSVPHGIMGFLEHTMVGNLLPGTVAWFNNPAAQASAHFGVDQGGSIHQFGPVNGWKAWHAAGGNPNWYGCEFADNGNPANPLTAAQISSAAQLLELLSRPDVGNFPLQLSNSTGTEGLGWHGMGGAAYGGHFDCPGDVRKAQRPAILALAVAIREGAAPAPANPDALPPVRSLEAAAGKPDTATLTWDSPAGPSGFTVGWYQVTIRQNGADLPTYPRWVKKSTNPELAVCTDLPVGQKLTGMVRALDPNKAHASDWESGDFETPAK